MQAAEETTLIPVHTTEELQALPLAELKHLRGHALYATMHALDEAGADYYGGIWEAAVDEYKRRRKAGLLDS